MKNIKTKETIARITEMEARFDALQASVRAIEEALAGGSLRENFGVLQEYMDSGQWLKDYEEDEKGKLPARLKRGVLSEDGLYNLLADARNLLQKING